MARLAVTAPELVSEKLADRTNTYVGAILVIIATTFNVLLCFVNTMHWITIGTSQVSVVQAGIFACGLYAIRNDVSESLITGAVLLTTLVAGLKIFNPDTDWKILFDVGLIPVFILLGRAASLKQVDRVVAVLITLVLAVGAAELLAPNAFERILDIRSYYLNKGAISINDINYSDTSFFTSGERFSDSGRNILGWLLGSHRVSSVFLEPVSMGNFPIICLIWLLSSVTRSARRTIALAVSIFICIVLPDSRYAAGCSVLMLLAWFGGWSRSASFTFILPIATLILLCAFGLTQSLVPGELPWVLSDDLPGRLRFSGALLDFWGPGAWLGFVPSPVYTADTGYAYVFNQIGLPAAVTLWAMLALSPAGSARGRLAHGHVAIYVATSLCIGASLFSIKTGALLWFIVGALQSSRFARSVDASTQGFRSKPP